MIGYEDGGLHGYLEDLFNVLSGVDSFSLKFPFLFYGINGIGRQEKKELEDLTPQQCLFLPNQPPVSSAAMDPSWSIDDLDAEFIESGPFKFTSTYRFREHLTLDSRNRVRIYVDLRKEFLTLDPYNGFDSFETYEGHFLRRF
jgi:hypothetical protein